MSSFNLSKKVIYLVNDPFTIRDFERFGVKNWISYNWEVQVFDVSKILYPDYWENVDRNKISSNFEGLKIFQNINEVLSAINNLKNKVVFIDKLGISNLEMRIRAVARAHGKLVKISTGSLPFGSINKNILSLFIQIMRPVIFMKKLISFVQEKFKKIKVKTYIDYLVVDGRKSIPKINENKTLIIQAHNLDYDFLVKENQVKSNKNSNYLVFIDQYLPYHPDYIKKGTKPPVSEDCYFSIIDHGLNAIAKSLKLNIKIAAHPLSNYASKQKKYNYPIFENKTFMLIRDAAVVISHCSTALGWAVFTKKPIIFITTDEIQNANHSRFAKNINNYATILGKKTVNFSQLSSKDNWINHLNIDCEKYEKFVENYIKIKGSPDKPYWNIVIEYIENDLSLLKKI